MARRILFLLLLWFPALVYGQSRSIILTQDSIERFVEQNWLFTQEDNPAFAAKDFDDRGWKKRHPRLAFKNERDTFIAKVFWFRLHVRVDSTMADTMLALQIFQKGASEYYLDGHLLEKFGTINGPDSSVKYSPNAVPIVFTFNDTGEHVFAVRYANFDAIKSYKRYEYSEAGADIYLAKANRAIVERYRQGTLQASLTVFIMGLFLSLALIHMLLYFQMRSDRSNLFFSLFALSLAFLFFILNRTTLSHNPDTKQLFAFLSIPLSCFLCCAQSGLLHNLFIRRRISFYLLTALAIVISIIRFFDFGIALSAMVFLVLVTNIESIIIISIAIYKKRQGALIMGFGMGLMLLLVMYIGVTIILTDKFLIDETSVAGQIFELALAAAILCLPISMSILLSRRYAAVSKDLKRQLEQVKLLSEKTLAQELEQKRLLENRQEELEEEVALRTREVRQQNEALKVEKKKSDDLLLNILPAEVAEELKESGASKARLYEDVSVLFTDFVNFTGVSEKLSPSQLVAELDHCFRGFDNIIQQYGLEKIKTIGDAYLAVSGLPAANEDHARNTILAAIAIRDFMDQRQREHDHSFAIRLGINSGPVVAGIVGHKKFAYDIWGDAVNIAARMEQHGETGKINISGTTYELVKNQFQCIYRGELEAKNKGKMSMYFVEGFL